MNKKKLLVTTILGLFSSLVFADKIHKKDLNSLYNFSNITSAQVLNLKSGQEFIWRQDSQNGYPFNGALHFKLGESKVMYLTPPKSFKVNKTYAFIFTNYKIDRHAVEISVLDESNSYNSCYIDQNKNYCKVKFTAIAPTLKTQDPFIETMSYNSNYPDVDVNKLYYIVDESTPQYGSVFIDNKEAFATSDNNLYDAISANINYIPSGNEINKNFIVHIDIPVFKNAIGEFKQKSIDIPVDLNSKQTNYQVDINNEFYPSRLGQINLPAKACIISDKGQICDSEDSIPLNIKGGVYKVGSVFIGAQKNGSDNSGIILTKNANQTSSNFLKNSSDGNYNINITDIPYGKFLIDSNNNKILSLGDSNNEILLYQLNNTSDGSNLPYSDQSLSIYKTENNNFINNIFTAHNLNKIKLYDFEINKTNTNFNINIFNDYVNDKNYESRDDVLFNDLASYFTDNNDILLTDIEKYVSYLDVNNNNNSVTQNSSICNNLSNGSDIINCKHSEYPVFTFKINDNYYSLLQLKDYNDKNQVFLLKSNGKISENSKWIQINTNWNFDISTNTISVAAVTDNMLILGWENGNLSHCNFANNQMNCVLDYSGYQNNKNHNINSQPYAITSFGVDDNDKIYALYADGTLAIKENIINGVFQYAKNDLYKNTLESIYGKNNYTANQLAVFLNKK